MGLNLLILVVKNCDTSMFILRFLRAWSSNYSHSGNNR